MGKAPLPQDERARLEALQRYQLLDTATEEQFDDIVKLASQICGTPISLISLIDKDRQWFKARKGLAVPETSRDYAFCAHAIHENELTIIEDATKDARFVDNPLVTNSPDIRFYAGAPLITHDHYRLGTLCVIDRVPRNLNEEQKFAMKVLADQVVKLMELRYHNLQLSRSLQTVSEQKKRIQILLQERVKLSDELTKANNTKDQLLSIVAHDLRSPLSTLKSLLTLISSKGETLADKAQYTSALSKSVEGAANLLENLLQWGSTQLNGQEPEKSQLNLHQLIEELKEELKGAAYQKKNAFHNRVPQDFKLRANATALNLILRNLLINANKFTSEGRVSIEAYKQEDGRTRVLVRDTGVGMDEETQNHLFELNKKYSRPGTANEKGSGLGLHMSREIIRQNGGDLHIESQPGKGTTVSVIFP